MKTYVFNDIEYSITRSTGRRKTLSVYVRPDGSVEVRCGRDVPLRIIENFIDEKQNWIRKKRDELLRKAEESSGFTYEEGALIPFMGKKFPLRFGAPASGDMTSGDMTSGRPSYDFSKQIGIVNNTYFVLPEYLKPQPCENTPKPYISAEYDKQPSNNKQPSGDNNHHSDDSNQSAEDRKQLIEKTIAKIYRLYALKYIPPMVKEQADIMGLTPTGLHITSARTRWGSCSGKNSVNFSCYLMKASPECIRYVIIHELAHIKHHDHSKKFWQLVERYCPDYRRLKQELRRL